MFQLGFQTLDVRDEQLDLNITCNLFYPSISEEHSYQAGPFTIRLAEGGTPAPGDFPLIVISHGSGGSNWVYRELAAGLAKAGFVVCLPLHPFNNRFDNGWSVKPDNLKHRPRHLGLVAQYCQQNLPFVTPGKVGWAGHSVGGYSALCAGGAQSQWFTNGSNCYDPIMLMAPSLSCFLEGGEFSKVQGSVWVVQGDLDTDEDGQMLHWLTAQLSKITTDLVTDANHYSFLSPFPKALAHRVGVASKDVIGFDRPEFLRRLVHQSVSFFEELKT
mgnify:CR=1 FL=1